MQEYQKAYIISNQIITVGTLFIRWGVYVWEGNDPKGGAKSWGVGRAGFFGIMTSSCPTTPITQGRWINQTWNDCMFIMPTPPLN